MAKKAKSKSGRKARTYRPQRRVAGEATPAADAAAAETQSTSEGQTATETAPAADAPTGEAEGAPKARKKAERKDGTMSGLDAAAKVLADAGEPLDCKTITERAIAQGLWKPGGKTPHATVYSAILREIQQKGEQSRFVKAERGKFAARA